MKNLGAIFLTLGVCAGLSIASEPSPVRNLADRVRFSTHIFSGEIKTFIVIDEATGKEITKPAEGLERGQRFEFTVKVGEVLQNDKVRGIAPGDVLDVRFGKRNDSYHLFKKYLTEKPLVFFLSHDEDHAGYYYPFFGETNLAENPTMVEEIKAVILKYRKAAK